MRFDFVRVADPDRVLDQVAEAEDRREKTTGERRDGDVLHLPYWAELWDSALALCQWLSRHAAIVRGCRVLDLGCGMGLVGSVASRLGASVMFADLEPDALLFAALNAAAGAPGVRCRRLNWRTDDLGERFDLILGADILYERTQWPYLESFWRRHLTDRGRILLGEPGRQTGDLFPAWLADPPWQLETLLEPVSTRAAPVRLFTLRQITVPVPFS